MRNRTSLILIVAFVGVFSVFFEIFVAYWALFVVLDNFVAIGQEVELLFHHYHLLDTL